MMADRRLSLGGGREEDFLTRRKRRGMYPPASQSMENKASLSRFAVVS